MNITIGKKYKWQRPNGQYEVVEVLEGPFMFAPTQLGCYPAISDRVPCFRVKLAYYGNEDIAAENQLAAYDRGTASRQREDVEEDRCSDSRPRKSRATELVH